MAKEKSDDGIYAVDLFSGAGGITEGLKNAGMSVIMATDIDQDFSAAHRHNHPDVPFLERDITELTPKEFSKSIRATPFVNGHPIHVLSGGPPCQGFSMTGRRNSDDPRNQLFQHYIKVLKELKPQFFFMENVTGMLTMKQSNGEKFFDNIMAEFRKKLPGYEIDYKVVNMAEYGVPQKRRRVIVLGNRLGIPVEECFPKPDHTEEDYETVWDNIKDLTNVDNDEIPNHRRMNHSKQIVERMSKVKAGKYIAKRKSNQMQTFQCVYQRLEKDKPAPTLVPGHSAFPIHPVEHRSLTFREAARLQTFPDEMVFYGSQIKQGLAVGNAVPPLFAEKLGKRIAQLIRENSKKTK